MHVSNETGKQANRSTWAVPQFRFQLELEQKMKVFYEGEKWVYPSHCSLRKCIIEYFLSVWNLFIVNFIQHLLAIPTLSFFFNICFAIQATNDEMWDSSLSVSAHPWIDKQFVCNILKNNFVKSIQKESHLWMAQQIIRVIVRPARGKIDTTRLSGADTRP